MQLLRILQAYVLGLGIGITVGFRYYLLFMPLSLIVLMMPISISGFGIPQAVITALLQPRGVPEADGFALSMLIVLSGIVANLPGALLYLSAAPVSPHGSATGDRPRRHVARRAVLLCADRRAHVAARAAHTKPRCR